MSRKCDIDFTVEYVPARYQDLVQRMAVLYPLLRTVNRPIHVVEGIQLVLRWWRARISALTELGWVPNAGKLSILYTRNCQPAFVPTTPETRYCWQPICPFCHARWVRSVWQRLDAGFPDSERAQEFFGETDPYALVHGVVPDDTQSSRMDNRELRSVVLDDAMTTSELSYPYHLVLRTVGFPMARHDPNNPGIDQAVRLRVLLQHAKQRQRELVAKIAPQGAFTYITAEPFRDYWYFRYRQVFRVAATARFPKELTSGKGVRAVRFIRLTRRQLVRVVARACRYPARLMLPGNEAGTLTFLSAKGHMHLSSYYGDLRNGGE